MSFESSIKGLIDRIDKSRTAYDVEGKNPKLNEYKSWYSGVTAWHHYTTVGKDGVTNKVRMCSGLPKIIAEDWASNYANEGTTISVPNDNENELVQQVLDNNNVYAEFNGFAELFNALGIGAMTVMPSSFVVDENGNVINDANTEVVITAIDADNVIPITKENGVVTECAFVKYATNKVTLQVHFKVNGYYVIAEVEAPKKKEQKEDVAFDYSKAKVLYTKSTDPLFQVWRPNISNISKDFASIFDGAEDWFKAADITFDCFYKEFNRGAKKRFISAKLLQIDENGNYFNVDEILDDEDIIIPRGDEDKSYVQDSNPELRVEPILRGLTSAMSMAARKCGLGDTTYELDATGGRPIQTATGVIAKETKLYKNIIKQENFATARFKDLIMAIKYVNNEFTSNIALTYNKKDIQVKFDDNILQDDESKKEQELKEVQAGIMSVAEYRSHWYGEDYDGALEFLQENAMLINTYLPSFSAGVITPDKFIDLVYGVNVQNREELKKQLEQLISPVSDVNYMNEDSNPVEDEEDEEEEKEETEED